MAQSELDIAVTADASGAVAAMDSLSASVGGFNSQLGSMAQTFERPLEHVGVHLFGRELLNNIGLMGESRAILPLLNVGVNQLAEGFGIAANSLGLWTFGLVAAAGVVYKVVESYERHHDSLTKLLDKQQKELETDDQLIVKIDKYDDAIGKLPPDLANLQRATEALTAAKREDAIVTSDQLIQAIQKQIAANQEELNGAEKALAFTTRVNERYKDTAAQREQNAQFIDNETQQVHRLTETYDSLAQKLARAQSEKIALQKGFANVGEELSGGVDAGNANKKDVDNFWKSQDEMIKIHAAMGHKLIEQSDQAANKMSHSFDRFNSAVSHSFAHAIIAGKGFTEALVDSMKTMAEQIIQDILKMILKMLEFLALKEAAGFGGLPIPTSFTSFMGHATGFSGIVDRPTPMMIGEGGEPEYVSITPASKMGGSPGQGSGGGGSAGNLTLNFNVNGAGDPRAVANEIYQLILQQTKGRGQVGPLGASIFGN